MTIVEVLVAALILVVVGLATGAAFVSAGAASSGMEARATALDVAQQEQQRLRGRSLVSLVGTRPTRTETVDGTPYTVNTTLAWVIDGAGATACSTTGGVSRRIQMTTTVTSPLVGSGRQRAPQAVVVRSSVAPSGAALQAAGGTVIAKVAGANETDPVVGLPVTFTPSGGGTATTVETNSAGCAIATGLTSGSWTVSAQRDGWVDANNNASASTTASVSTGKTTTTDTLRYAQSGSLRVTYGASDSTNRRAGQGNGATWTAPNGATGSTGPLSASAGTTYPGIVRSGTTTTVDTTLGHLRPLKSNGGSIWEANRRVVLRSMDANCRLQLEYYVYPGNGVLDRRNFPDRAVPFGSWRICLQARTSGTNQYAQPVTVSVTSQSLSTPQDVVVPAPTSESQYTTDAQCAL